MSLRLAIALAMLTVGAGHATPGFAADATPAVAAAPATPAWVNTSNGYSSGLLRVQAVFSPEDVSGSGLSEFDGLAMDLGPGINDRSIAAMQMYRGKLEAALNTETDIRIQQDLHILIHSIDQDITGMYEIAVMAGGSAGPGTFQRDFPQM